MMPAHETYDVIIIGAGAGGMTAAAVAAAEGLRVLVIEKTAFVGGTAAWSGGMVWIPANAKMKDAGLSDSITDAVRYLSSTVPEPANAGLRAAFLARGPEAVAWLEANTDVRLQPVKAYPDYYPERLGATSGGRVLEPVAFDGTRLGRSFARLRPPLPEFTLFGGMMVNRLDIRHLRRVGKSLRSTLRAALLVSEYAWQRLRSPRGMTLHLGNALAARLYASLLARQVEILFSADVEDLSMQGDRVSGVVIRHGSRDRSIAARRGVVLATGGFSHDATLRKRFFPPAAGFVSATNPAGTGDGLRLAATAGAALNTEATSPAYWVPASLFRRADGSRGVFPHTVTDRAKPGVIAVNAAGRRFVNEALSYHEFVLAMLRDGNGEPDRPFYLICDRPFLWAYGLGRIKPFTRNVRRYVASGELVEGMDIAELAAKTGIKPSVLTATIASYNSGGGPRPRVRTRQHHLPAPPWRRRPQAQSLRRADRRCAVLRDAHLSGRSRHGDRHEGGCARTRAARGRHADRWPLCLRQRYGLDHERQLSGAGDHARTGADVRIHRGAASGGGGDT